MATSVDSLSIQITASTKQAKDKVDALCESLNRLVVAINALDVSKFEALSNAANGLSQGLQGIKSSGVRSVEKMADAIDRVQSKSGSFDPIAQGAEKVTVATEEAARGAEEVKETLGALHAEPLDELANAAEKASASMENSAKKMSAFKSMLASLKIIVPTDSLVEVNKKIDKLQAKVADLKDKLAFNSKTNPDYIDSKEMEKDQQQIQGLINELERLKLKKQELESHGGFKFNDFGKGISNLHSRLSAVNKKLDGFASKLFKAKTASRESSKSTKEFSLSANKLASELFRVSKMLKLMITRMALRTIIKEVGNGFKSLALHSEEFNSAMSGLINSSKQLGYSFSAMVGPLINALAPALIYLIELIMKAINAVNQLFSALSGKTTYSKAKNFSENWADNIKAANKQAKELKKTVLGFDELNQLTDKTTSGGDTSGNIEDMFEDVAIESKWKDLANYIKNLAKKLFDPIKKAWEKVGDFVKKSWKYAMDEVLKLGKSIARDFWKVWEQEKTQKIFENILKVIGYIGLAVGNLAKRFREAWDKNDTGLHILENIRDIILIITEHIERMAKATAEWADRLDFSPILTKFNEWLESMKPVVDNLMGIVEDFYTTVILPLGDWAIKEGGPQLLQVFIDFNNKVDWEGLRDKLKELWEHLEPFMETVGEGLIIFIRDVSDALAEFINSETFENFLKTIEDWMDSVSPQDVADGLKAICAAIIGFAAARSVLSILTAIAGFLTTIAALGGLVKVALVITVAVVGFKIGGKIGEWLTGDKATYDEFSWWGEGGFFETVFGGIGGIDDAIERIGELKDAWEEMTHWAGDGISGIINAIEGIYNPLGTLVRALEELAGFRFNWKTLSFEKLQDDMNNTAGVSDRLKGKMDELNDKFTHTSSSGITTFRQALQDTHKTLDESPQRAQTFRSALGEIKTSLEDTTKATQQYESDTTVSFTNVENEVAGVGLSYSGTMKEMSLDTESASEDVIKATDKIKDAFDEKEWTFEGIGSGLKKSFEKAKEGIKGVWNSIADKLNGEYELGEGKFKINLPRFALGGFPDENGIFMANSSELIGRFSNGRTAVANNAEIVEGISAGVYSAVTSAMAQSGGSNRYIANTIVVDGEVIARTVTKAQSKQNMRYSPQMI